MSKYIVEFKPDWVKNNKIEYSKNLFEIIRFYMIETPCNGVSSRGLEFEKLGWSGKELNALFEYMMLSENIKENVNYYKYDNINNTQKKIAETMNVKKEANLIIMHKTEKPIYNLLYYIRCAIAHGRFLVLGNKNKTYILENIKSDKANKNMVLKAKIVLKESTLINWINLIRDGKKKFDKKIEKIKLEYKKTLYDYISKNKKITEADIKKLIVADKSLYKKYFKALWEELRLNKKVYYDR